MRKRPRRSFWWRWTRRILLTVLAIVMAAVGIVAYANITAMWASRGRLFDDVDEIPDVRVGLVFGTSHRSPYFRHRIAAAAEVWNAGKLDTIIVSGDNLTDTEFYNEPLKMAEALMELGVPENRIVSDEAGLRTLDSVVRSKMIYGANPVLFISQRFQNERAIYLAKAHGIEAYGYNARDVEFRTGMRIQLREVRARVKMWLDVNFLHTRPRHLGEKIDLPD